MRKALIASATMMLAWASLATAQAPDQPKSPQLQERQEAQQAGQQAGQETVRGRIVAIDEAPRPGQARQTEPGGENPAARAGQGSAQGFVITVMAQPAQGGQQPRGEASRPANQPLAGEAQQGQAKECHLIVKEETRIENRADAQQTQTRPPDQQEHRGLEVGQQVEVTYRPMPGADSPLAGRENTQQPRQPAATTPAQGDQAGSQQMVQGEAVTIRILTPADANQQGTTPRPSATRPGTSP